MIDLHLHSTCSDGQDTPEELVKIAVRAGISVMALTDHDTINGLMRAKNTANELGIGFISGIEISVQGGKELHILGYGVDPDSEILHQFYESNRSHRLKRRDRLIELFNNAGIPITLEKICEANNGKSTGRPHFARTLVEMGYAKSVQDAFDRYLTTPEFYCIERPKPTAQEGIAMIKKAGGISVLAHPYTLKLEDKSFRELIQKLISYGLRGIECYYSKHTPEQIRYYRSIAHEYGLISTCGSDYHGSKVKPDIMPGSGCDDSLIKACVPEKEILTELFNEINM
ncbi:MAG: PHP domain-containing protein [Oscillospiraceae bacterium]|nr:PHP domain-containing protein [Oscillospiraceae bacterium]